MIDPHARDAKPADTLIGQRPSSGIIDEEARRGLIQQQSLVENMNSRAGNPSFALARR
jgi:hypothetical protein